MDGTNKVNTLNSFYSNNTGLSQLETPSPKPSVFNIYSWSWFSWFIFFIVLALLGFNVFVFLAKGTMTFVDFFILCVSKIYRFFEDLFKGLGNKNYSLTKSPNDDSKTVTNPSKIEASAEKSNETPTAISKDDEQMNVGTEDDIVKALKREKIEKLFPPSSNSSSELERKEKKQTGGLSQREQGQEEGRPGQGIISESEEPHYSADDSYSSIQMSKTASKSGWCFIGEDRGFRSCIRVGENEKCMSGDIFPSQDICINPNLRF